MIADSIELVARGNGFDGLVILVGCDKTIPGAVMALARLNVPGVVLYGGSIAPGMFQGKPVHPGRLRGGRCPCVGHHERRRLPDARGRRVPGAGACGGQFTANTMAIVRGARHRRARQRQRAGHRSGEVAVGRTAGEQAVKLAAGGVRPRNIITPRAIRNAIAVVAATGGSTNAVLHLLAIAREAGIELSLADFDRISAKTPLIADLKPSGRFVATELHAAGGTPLVIRRLVESGGSTARRRP